MNIQAHMQIIKNLTFFTKRFLKCSTYISLGWCNNMPSSTITVRFEKPLYERIKRHPMCTSDIIRNGVEMFLDSLEAEKQFAEKPNSSEENRDVRPVITNDFYDMGTIMLDEIPIKHNAIHKDGRNSYFNEYTPEIVSLSMIDQLKSEVNDLNKELGELLDKYKQTKK